MAGHIPSAIMDLNRDEPRHPFHVLPKPYQEYMKRLHRMGVIIEVYGQKTRAWQVLNQSNVAFTPNNYYRTYGAAHAALLKESHTVREKGVWVHIGDLQKVAASDCIAIECDGVFKAQIQRYK